MLRSAASGLVLTLALTVSAFAAPQKNLDRYVGQYRYVAEPEIVLSVFHTGDHLTVETARKAAVVLSAQTATGSEAKFTAPASGHHVTPGSEIQYAFIINTAGKVTGVRSEQGGKTAYATKISATPVHNRFRQYDREEVMIPMRDGVNLHAIVLRPTGVKQPLPFLLQRTPYGVDNWNSNTINEMFTELARSGYIFVMEDIRGRYESQGEFVMMRPIAAHHDPNSSNPNDIDESTDAYDTVAWLVKHIPDNNGRVGVLGVSYPGFTTIEAGIDPNPHVKAISPQAPAIDMWRGDDFFHNGAFRQSYGYDYVLGMESSKKATWRALDEDAYNYFLDAGSAAAAGRKGDLTDLPTWKAFLSNPEYDAFWQTRAVERHLTEVSVPTLLVGGYWDQEDMWGPQEAFATLKPHDTKHEVFMVLGPWNHGQWVETTRHLGALDFGSVTTDAFRQRLEAPFFAYYLKDQPGFNLKNVASFQTGSDRWMRYDAWPPKDTVMRNLYLGANHQLTFTKPQDTQAFTEYASDPAHPVNYRKRPIEATYAPGGSGWYTWLVQDQRPYDHRPDVAGWTSDVLTHNVTVTGDVMADLFASTSGTDSDWVVKLIDVYPETSQKMPAPDQLTVDPKMSGYQLMIVDEIFRGRYRESREHPEAIPANQVEEYKYSLHAADHVFRSGHRIMVQVQSTWFPLYDRNPQTFVPNIMTANPQDYVKANQKIFAGSHLELPVVNR
jgi:putative CocE/NonD family hydrolase